MRTEQVGLHHQRRAWFAQITLQGHSDQIAALHVAKRLPEGSAPTIGIGDLLKPLLAASFFGAARDEARLTRTVGREARLSGVLHPQLHRPHAG